MIADRRLCLTADRSQVVEQGDARAKWLLVGAGREIGEGAVKQYGLSVDDAGRVMYAGCPLVPVVKQAPTPENKMAAGVEDKGVAVEPATEQPVAASADEAPVEKKGRSKKKGG